MKLQDILTLDCTLCAVPATSKKEFLIPFVKRPPVTLQN